MNFIEACRKFISIDSSPSHGTKAIGEMALEICRERGLFVQTQEEYLFDLPQMNIIARPVAERPALELMLQTHLDTVDPGPFGLWSENGHNPFDAHIIDGRIYGLGAADVKLDFLCKLEAITSFPANTNWKLPPVLVGTYGEELGMLGAMKLIRKNMISCRTAFVGEPSDLKLIVAAKGFAGVEIRVPFSDDELKYRQEHNLRESTSTQSKIFNGKSAHSSNPQLGDSAIKKMLDYLLQLPEGLVVMEIDGGVNYNTVPSHAFLELDLVSGHHDSMAAKICTIYREIKNLEHEFLQYQDHDFNPQQPTLNIGIIRTMEDHVFIAGTCRLPPIITNEIYESWIKRLNQLCSSVGSQFRVTDYKRPFRTEKNSILARVASAELERMGIFTGFGTQASTNEASLFSRTGIECICFGPGAREGNIHTPKENVLISDLEKATAFYKKMIERFCL